MNGTASRIYSITLDLVFLQCVGKIKKGVEHDTEVSQLPEPCFISSSLISFFLCHPDDLISNGFWNESCVLAHFVGSFQHSGMC